MSHSAHHVLTVQTLLYWLSVYSVGHVPCHIQHTMSSQSRLYYIGSLCTVLGIFHVTFSTPCPHHPDVSSLVMVQTKVCWSCTAMVTCCRPHSTHRCMSVQTEVCWSCTALPHVTGHIQHTVVCLSRLKCVGPVQHCHMLQATFNTPLYVCPDWSVLVLYSIATCYRRHSTHRFLAVQTEVCWSCTALPHVTGHIQHTVLCLSRLKCVGPVQHCHMLQVTFNTPLYVCPDWSVLVLYSIATCYRPHSTHRFMSVQTEVCWSCTALPHVAGDIQHTVFLLSRLKCVGPVQHCHMLQVTFNTPFSCCPDWSVLVLYSIATCCRWHSTHRFLAVQTEVCWSCTALPHVAGDIQHTVFLLSRLKCVGPVQHCHMLQATFNTPFSCCPDWSVLVLYIATCYRPHSTHRFPSWASPQRAAPPTSSPRSWATPKRGSCCSSTGRSLHRKPWTGTWWHRCSLTTFSKRRQRPWWLTMGRYHLR